MINSGALVRYDRRQDSPEDRNAVWGKRHVRSTNVLRVVKLSQATIDGTKIGTEWWAGVVQGNMV